MLKNTSNPTNDAGIALTVERAENWAATFQIKDVALDGRDPNTVNLIGTQKITKNVNGSPFESERDVQLAVKVHADAAGRQDYNRPLA